MASYRQRGKSKLWDYRIFDKQGKVVATNSGFKRKRKNVGCFNQIIQLDLIVRLPCMDCGKIGMIL